MKTIQYVKGDATRPSIPGNKVIAHICNDIGGWGRGFVLALSKRWPEPEKQYRAWAQSKENFKLGQVQFVKVESDIWIANMVGQQNVINDEDGNPPIRYVAVLECLEKVGAFAIENNASIHLPRIGCGLAGGTWDKIEPLIKAALIEKKITVTVYDLDLT